MGFFSKKELEKTKVAMRGAYLREFVDSFLEHDDGVYKVGIDLTSLELIHEEIGNYRPKTEEAYFKRLEKVCRKLNFDQATLDAYLAATRRSAIRNHYMSDMPLALRTMELGIMQKSDFVDYFVRTQLSKFDPCEILLFIYPAKRDRTIEDYDLPREHREKLTDFFYETLEDLKQLKAVVATFAELHPYYRFYPFK